MARLSLGGPLGGLIGGVVNGIINSGKKPGSSTSNKPSNSSSSSGSGWSGSASGVVTSDSYQQQIKNQMNANSQAWHGASAAEQKRLQEENQRLAAQLGGSVTYDPTTGKWGGAAAQRPPETPNLTMDQLREEWGYNDLSAAEQAAIDAYIKQSVNGLESQKSGVVQSADDAARQAYVSYMQSQTALPQALAASGYSGGMADSQRLALDTGLQNNQNSIMQNRDNALNDINTAIQQTRLEGSIQGAQAQAQLGREAINAYQNYISQQNATANQNYWNKYGYDFQGGQAALDRLHQNNMQTGNQQWQSGENQADRDWKTQENQAARDFEAMAARVKQKAGGGGNGGNAGTVLDDMVKRFNSGDYSDDVIAALRAAGYSDEQLKAAGYVPTAIVSDYSQLGAEAQRILNGASRAYGGTEGIVDQLERAFVAGTVTEAEAGFILKAIGY